jgi:hypothetical protein
MLVMAAVSRVATTIQSAGFLMPVAPDIGITTSGPASVIWQRVAQQVSTWNLDFLKYMNARFAMNFHFYMTQQLANATHVTSLIPISIFRRVNVILNMRRRVGAQ